MVVLHLNIKLRSFDFSCRQCRIEGKMVGRQDVKEGEGKKRQRLERSK
jgi:hypothetical protein